MPISDFTIKKEISRSAEVSDSNLQSKHIVIESVAKLRHVDITARKILLRSNSILTDCKIFSDGVVDIGKDVIIELDILNANTDENIAKHFIAFLRRYGIKIKSSRMP